MADNLIPPSLRKKEEQVKETTQPEPQKLIPPSLRKSEPNLTQKTLSTIGKVVEPILGEDAQEQFKKVSPIGPIITGREKVEEVAEKGAEFAVEQFGKAGLNPYVNAALGTLVSMGPTLVEATALAGEAVDDLGNAFRKWVSNRVLTKSVKVPIKADDLQELQGIVRKNVPESTYNAWRDLPVEKRVDIAKKVFKEGSAELEAKVPRFGKPTVEPASPDVVNNAVVEGETLGTVLQKTQQPISYPAKLVPPSKLKSVVRQTTGQFVKQKPTITEKQALKRSLQIQEKTAKQAARYERNKINEANRLIKNIKKADINEITSDARVKINSLQKELKTTKTLEGLRDLNSRIQAVKDIGKQEVAANKLIKKKIYDSTLESLNKTLDLSASKKPPTAITKPEDPNFLKMFRVKGLRPTRWLDVLDGGQDFKGPFHQTFYDQINRAYTKEVDLTKQGTVTGLDILKNNGITSKELGQTIVVDDIPITIDQAMHIYGGFNNPETRQAIALGNRISVKTQKKIIEQLPAKFKKAADDLVKEMDSHYDRLRLSLLEFTNGKDDIGRVEGNYIPIKRINTDYSTSDKELLDEFAHRRGLRKAYAERSFTKERVQTGGLQNPIRLGLSEIYFNHVPKREHFINMGNVVKELQQYTGNKNLMSNIRKKFGQEYVIELQDYVNRMGNPSIYRSHTQLEKAFRVAREKAVLVNLGFNLVTMGKQVPSLFLMLGEVGPIELLNAVAETTTNFNKVNKFVESNDPQMAQRNIERELEEMRKVRPQGPVSAIQKLGEKSLKGIVLFDKIVTRAAWLAKYNSSVKNGASPSEAADEAQKAVLRTQPASAPKDIASFYASNEFLNLFTQFTNQLNQMYNMATYDIPMRAKLGKYKSAVLGGTGITLDMLLIWMLANGKLPEKQEDFTDAITDTALSSVPVIGPMMNSWRKGFDGLPAAFEVAKKISRGGRSLYKAIDKDDPEQVWKALDAMAYSAAFAYGIPYNQLRRTLGGVVDLGTGKTDDLRRLVFSPYQLGINKKNLKIFNQRRRK